MPVLREGAALKRGTFVVASLIGRGGFGEVYLARQPRMDRQVAIKVLNPSVGEDQDILRRFEREALAAGSLLHPNVLPVFDFDLDEETGVWFLAMQYVPGGRTLKDHMDRALDLQETARIVAAVGSALDAAHARGIVHRDVKPANVLMDGDRPMLTDFGIAHLGSLTGLTGAGMAVGTPAYLSPEQALGRAVGPRSDQYSLAVMAFEMLTNRLPFSGDSVSLVMQHVNTPAPPVDQFNPDVPLGARVAVSRGLSKNPDDRYESCAGFAAALLEVAPDATMARTPSGTGALTGTIGWATPTQDSPVPRPTEESPVPVGPSVPTQGAAVDIYSLATRPAPSPATMPTPVGGPQAPRALPRGRLYAWPATGALVAIVLLGAGGFAVAASVQPLRTAIEDLRWAASRLLGADSSPVTTPLPSPPAIATGAPATSLPPNMGSVILRSSPPAAIIVNGEPAGRTPRELQLQAGDYDLTLVAPTFKEWTSRISLAAGQQISVPPIDLAVKPASEVLQVTDTRLGKDPVIDARDLIRLQTPSETFLLSDDVNAIVYVRPQTFGIRDVSFKVTMRWVRSAGFGNIEQSAEQKVLKEWEETFLRACAPATALDPRGSNFPITLDVLIDDELASSFTFRISGGNPANAPPSQCDATALPRTVAFAAPMSALL